LRTGAGITARVRCDSRCSFTLEFADDHIPGALSAPVLSDAQRAEVGTLHQKVSSFAARKRGAALVARNIAQLLDDGLSDHGRPVAAARLLLARRQSQRGVDACARAHRLAGAPA